MYYKLRFATWLAIGDLITKSVSVGLSRIPRRKRANRYRKGQVLHITSRCHFGSHLLGSEAVKGIVARELLHYARVCRVEVLHFSFMDNHIHILLRFTRKTRHTLLAKMVGTFKAQVSRKYKRWYNKDYRASRNWRPAKLGKGSLWDDRFTVTVVLDSAGFLREVGYVELNRHRAAAGLAKTREEAAEVVDQMVDCKTHSARFYLCDRDPGPVTDGKDGVWASREEVKKYGLGPLPGGWRRVRFDGHLRLLKPTPWAARTFPDTAFSTMLGRLWGTRRRGFREFLILTILTLSP